MMPDMNTVIRATLADQAHTELRSRILGGKLPSGYRLLPEELAVDLSISQTPIKEALLRLEGDGLVVSELRKGAIVRLFTLKDVEELYEARMLIELDAIGVAFERRAITPELLEDLSQNLERHAFHLSRPSLKDLTTALAFDREFHHKLILGRDNAVISAWHQRILTQTHTAYVYLASDTSRVFDEHREILDALKAGSAAQAKAALENHLNRSRESLLDNVRRSLQNEPKR
jgi:DNA-binding GntR family transcriptional regulator